MSIFLKKGKKYIIDKSNIKADKMKKLYGMYIHYFKISRCYKKRNLIV